MFSTWSPPAPLVFYPGVIKAVVWRVTLLYPVRVEYCKAGRLTNSECTVNDIFILIWVADHKSYRIDILFTYILFQIV